MKFGLDCAISWMHSNSDGNIVDKYQYVSIFLNIDVSIQKQSIDKYRDKKKA